MDNFSVGVDIELISRFQDLSINKSKLFLSKIFTKAEIEYCFSKKNPAQHLAVRFAAKEAVVKAISYFGKENVPLNKIEVVKKNNGAPLIKLVGYNIRLSLSHCKDMAIAFIIAEKS